MLCPKCNIESERRFCGRCGLDLGVYQELSALRAELESIQHQLSGFAGVPSGHLAAVPAEDALKQSHVADSSPKPPPLPRNPAQVERVAKAKSSTELALGQKWFLGIGVLVLIIGIGFFL